MRIIAFYLPQFHEIPENNQWWGKGFTEWTNTRKAKPLYPGHYQPREPYQDAYYDLLDPKVMVEQMRLAKRYGVGGFCFYHYWFNGKKLLEKPVEALLENKEANLPFCLSWANEPWTRTWDGDQGAKEILMPQRYGDKEDWEQHFIYLLSFFKDDRYIKIDGKPMFLIYRSASIPKCNDMLVYWQELAVKHGLPGIYFVQMITNFSYDKRAKYYSACVEFEPMRTLADRDANIKAKWKRQYDFYLKYKSNPILSRFLLNQLDYDSIYETITNRKLNPKKKIYLGAFPDWDNSPRKKEKGIMIYGSSPKKFEKYLTIQIERSLEMGNEFLFINAWNEWGEGAYLEADKRYGYAYLHAIRNALQKTGQLK